MAKEATIKKNGLKKLEKEGYVTWCPPNVRYAQTDVFGIYDCLALKDSELRCIQWTSKANISARMKKIQAFFEENKVFLPSEVWGYDDKKKEFIIKYI